MRNPLPKRLSGKWKHLLVCPNRIIFTELAALLAEVSPTSPAIDLGAYPSRRSLVEMVTTQAPNICFLDVGSNRDTALALLAELSAMQPSIPIVAVHSSNDPDLILRCLRQGAGEFLFQPFT